MSGFRTFEASAPMADGLRFVTVKSAALGQRADISLWAPEGAVGSLPLVILLHGVYGSHWAWALKGDAHRTAQRLIATGALPPCALAMPSDGLWGDGSGYMRHDGQDFERWIVDEVPRAAQAAGLPVEAQAPFALAGLSMGGFGALRLAARHPQRVRAAAGLSSLTRASQLDALLAEPRTGWDEEDADLLPLLLCPDMPPFALVCGQSDPYIAAHRELHQQLQWATVPHVYQEHAGGHDWAFWREHLGPALQFRPRDMP
ncbi:MAG: alpha/beta hydrolase [Burkholderiales bacterium]